MSTPSISSSIGVGITSDVGAVANTLTEAEKLAAQINAEKNTAAEVAAQTKANEQALRDKAAQAVADAGKDNLNEIRKLSS